jgi:hypothetical protein
MNERDTPKRRWHWIIGAILGVAALEALSLVLRLLSGMPRP